MSTQIRGLQIKNAFFGAGLVRNSGDNNVMDVNVDDSSIEISSDALRIKANGVTDAMLANDYIQTSEVDGVTIEATAQSGGGVSLNVVAGGIGTTELANDSVDKDKINADIAGLGLVQNVDGSLEVNVDDSTVEIATDTLQIKAGGVDTTQLANDSVDKDKINADVAGLGLGQNVDGSLEVNVDDSSIEISTDTLQVKASGITNAMLAGSITDDKLDSDYIQTSEVDDVTIEATAVSGGGVSLNVKAGGIDTTELANEAVTEAKMDILDAPADGEILSWNDSEGKFEWVANPAVSGVTESDISVEDESANCDGIETDFTLSNTPVTNSVQVFLNGLLQQAGSGKDYELSGTTVSFTTAPESGDILIIHYVINN